MSVLGVGLIGAGNISDTYLRLAPLFADFEIRAVSDIDMDRARAQAAGYGMRAETVDEMLSAGDIDLIVNLTVPKAHYAVSRRILEAGKHCYSEKPVVLTLDEGRALLDLAAARGLRLGSAPDTFLGGAHQTARALLDAGAIGEVVGGTAHVMSRGMEHWHPNPDFFFQPGGGPVLDLGPYYITDLVQLLGPVRAVSAMGWASFPTRTIGSGPREGETVLVETPTTLHGLMEFEGGAIVTLGASWDVWRASHPHIELYGAVGTMQLPDPNNFGGEVTVAEGPAGFAAAEVAHPFAAPNDGEEGEVANYRGAGLADMVRAIDEGRAHRCNGDLALHVVDVMLGILASAERREWVEMTTTAPRPAPLPPEAARKFLKNPEDG
ncbi:MAG: Gfo/Idh/MocA family oxidoreductase [Paracoccaceae bacterium]|nr:Gfo/Idh/MocA family oxidoreductase [Paracoccaceae bacterium]